MRKFLLFTIVAILAIMVHAPAQAIGISYDPARDLTIKKLQKMATKTVLAQSAVQELEETGYKNTEKEIRAATDFQQDFKEYLDSFRNILSAAAELYGVYYEVTVTAKRMKELSKVVAESPTNVMAAAFSARRNKAYVNLVNTSLNIIMDIRKVCFERSMTTEWERKKILTGIRPKLRKFNRELGILTLVIRYTSFSDTLGDIVTRANRIDPTTRRNILARCKEDWIRNAKSVKPAK